MQVDKLEEYWTPTAIEATFALRNLPACTTGSRSLSIPLPLRSHGWTFALSLSPERRTTTWHKPKSCHWALTAFEFRQHDSQTSWGNTSMQAELSLRSGDLNHGEPQSESDDATSPSCRVSLGTVLLEHTPSIKRSVAPTYKLLLKQTVSLSVKISDCPSAHGFFQTQSVENDGEVAAQMELFRQSGDQVLGRSLSTGKAFDLKFLSALTRSPSGSTGKLFPTYASLSVLEKHINLSDSKFNDGWTAALKAGDDPDEAGPTHTREILCPSEYEYELDSDYEDEDAAPSFVEPDVSPPQNEPSATISIDKQPERNASRSSGSLSSFELASDQELIDDQPEETVQDSGAPAHAFSAATADCGPTVLVKFAAHRTWHAFLWYCYTGRVEFDQLRSQSDGARCQRVLLAENGPPPCSPKSMYRLANLVGDKDLKDKALKAIKQRMTEANVLDEILSVFTSKHPDVLELQLDVLVGYCKSPEVKRGFLKTVMNHNNMPHVEPVISAFYDRLVK